VFPIPIFSQYFLIVSRYLPLVPIFSYIIFSDRFPTFSQIFYIFPTFSQSCPAFSQVVSHFTVFHRFPMVLHRAQAGVPGFLLGVLKGTGCALGLALGGSAAGCAQLLRGVLNTPEVGRWVGSCWVHGGVSRLFSSPFSSFFVGELEVFGGFVWKFMAFFEIVFCFVGWGWGWGIQGW